MRVKTVLLFLLAAVFAISPQVRGEMLLNGGFEEGSPIPTYWNTWGGGSYIIRTDESHGGSRCMELGGGDLAVIAERWLESSCGECGGADISGDEKVDMEDFARMGAEWFLN